MDFPLYFQKVILLWQGSIGEIDYGFWVFGPYFIGKSLGTLKFWYLDFGHLSDTPAHFIWTYLLKQSWNCRAGKNWGCFLHVRFCKIFKFLALSVWTWKQAILICGAALKIIFLIKLVTVTQITNSVYRTDMKYSNNIFSTCLYKEVKFTLTMFIKNTKKSPYTFWVFIPPPCSLTLKLKISNFLRNFFACVWKFSGRGGGHKRLLLVSCSVSVVVIQ